jgi:hypothetical protein
MDIGLIISLAEAGLSIWKDKSATKYQKKLYKLKEKRFDETDKDQIDWNIVGHIDRDIMLLGSLVASEIQRSGVSTQHK